MDDVGLDTTEPPPLGSPLVAAAAPTIAPDNRNDPPAIIRTGCSGPQPGRVPGSSARTAGASTHPQWEGCPISTESAKENHWWYRPNRKDILAAAPPSSAADLIFAKLAPPDLPPHVVARTALVNRLRAAGSAPTASIVAPTGYGKTTLMCQWAARDRRPFAWVSLDAHDDDPRTLLEYIATALDRIETLDPSIFRALRSSRSPI